MEMGTIHDCYIAEYDKPNNDMKLLGFVYRNDAQSCRDYNYIQDEIGPAFFKNLPSSLPYLMLRSQNTYRKGSGSTSIFSMFQGFYRRCKK